MSKVDYLNELKEIDILLLKNMFFVQKGVPAKYSPSPLQLKIFRCLRKSGMLSQSDLEKRLHVSRATISGTLFTMEKNGAVERILSEKDARVKYVRLTEKSLNAYTVMQKRMDELNRKIAKGIPDEDLVNFIKVLNMMKENLRIEEKSENNSTKRAEGKIC